MIYRLIDLPSNVIGFKVLWQITDKDFEEVLIPSVEEQVEKTGQLNCLLILNKSIRNFRLSAIKRLSYLMKWKKKWRRVAIVAESKWSKMAINFLNMLAPGKFKGFSHTELDKAINWASR